MSRVQIPSLAPISITHAAQAAYAVKGAVPAGPPGSFSFFSRSEAAFVRVILILIMHCTLHERFNQAKSGDLSGARTFLSASVLTGPGKRTRMSNATRI